MSLLARLTSIFLLLPTIALANVDAGAIGKIRGSGVLERNNEVIDGDTGVGVMSMDTAVTARGQASPSQAVRRDERAQQRTPARRRKRQPARSWHRCNAAVAM